MSYVAPAGTAELYTAAECWEDFLFGIYLWGLAITPLIIPLLRKACSLPDDNPGLAGLRAVFVGRRLLAVVGIVVEDVGGDALGDLWQKMEVHAVLREVRFRSPVEEKW